MRNHPITFHIRFTEKEYDRLCKRAAKAGLPKSTYIRHMINGMQPKDARPADYFAFMRQLYSVGNNLNQLMAMGHTLGWMQNERLKASMDALDELILQITDAMILPEKVDVKTVLKRGRQVAEQDSAEG